MNIYFKNKEGRHQYSIFEKDVKIVYEIISMYRQIVPKILITDTYDRIILEIENKKIINQNKNDIKKIEEVLNKISTKKQVNTDIKELLEQYNIKLNEFISSGNFNLKEELIDLFINLSALNAVNNFSEKDIQHIDMIIEVAEMEIPEKLEKYFPYLDGLSDSNKTLIILPITRIVFEGRPFCMDKYQFLPPRTIDYRKIFNINDGLFGNSLREITKSYTLFSVDILYNNYCIAFMYDLKWNEFRNYPNHKSDVTLLKLLSDSTNEYFDLINFYGCSLTLSDTLPGEVGTWIGSNDYLGAFLFNENEGTYYIAGSAIESSRVVKGLGLDISDSYLSAAQILNNYTDSEVSKVIKYALSIYKDALYANNKTIKFIRMMTLFEYLAFPNEYKNFQTIKKYIICHSAKNKTDYHKLSERFKVFSEEYRTEIVHNGKTLESVITDYDERENLLKEVEKYFKITINSMFKYIDNDWKDFDDYRTNLIKTLT